jgi:hypothetical protein
MSDPIIFKIYDGQLGLAVVDRSEVGYSDAWRAPGGKSVDQVALADYDAGSGTFMCQVTSAQITSSPDTTTEDIEATMCAAGRTVPTPGESSFGIDIGALSDLNQVNGLQRFAFEHDAEEVYVYVGFDGTNPPRAIGRVMMASLPIGGDMRAKLLGTVTWPFTGKPQVEFGNATDSAVIPSSTATGATAGTPGAWTPTGATPPATVADLIAGTPNVVTASPATAWTTGQYVQTQAAGAGGQAHWSGTAWVASPATLDAEAEAAPDEAMASA